MDKTYTEIVAFVNIGAAYLKAHDKAESKLTYAIRKVSKTCGKRHEAYAEAVEDLRIEHCVVDPKNQAILHDERGAYVFTKDGMRAFIKAEKVLRETAVEITPHIVPDVPDDLTAQEREAFAGFVLADDGLGPLCEVGEPEEPK